MTPLALCLIGLAATPKVEVAAAPIFLVLRTSKEPVASQREVRLHDEVSLLMDNFAVLSLPVEAPDFLSRSLAQQLQEVLALADRNCAVGALWLAEPLPGQLMVHVVGIGTGRSLIRTLEFDRRSGSEKALALIVRELLGTAFLKAAPDTIDPQLAAVVRGVRRELPKDPVLEQQLAPPPPALPPSSYSLAGALVTGLAVAGAEGRWLSLGGRLRGEHVVVGALSLGGELEVHSARDLEQAARVTSLEVPLGVTASLALPVGAVVLTPRVSVLVGWNRLWAQNLQGAALGDVWTLRTRLGLEGRARNGERLQLVLGVSLDALPLRGGVRDELTGQDLWRAPWLEAHFAAGFLWKG